MTKGKRRGRFWEIDEGRDGLRTKTPLAREGRGRDRVSHGQESRSQGFATGYASRGPLNWGQEIRVTLAAVCLHILAEDYGRGPAARTPS